MHVYCAPFPQPFSKVVHFTTVLCIHFIPRNIFGVPSNVHKWELDTPNCVQKRIHGNQDSNGTHKNIHGRKTTKKKIDAHKKEHQITKITPTYRKK